MAYSRARPSWIDWPDTSTLVRAQDIDQWDQAIYELKGQIFDPEEYGSVGGSDDSSAINSAAAAANANGGGIVPIRLAHNITHTVVVPSYVILRATGWGAGLRSTSAITMLQLRDDITGTVEGVGVENLRITGVNAANGATGIQWAYWTSGAPVRSARTNYMSNCWIGNCDEGLHLVFDQGIRVSSCRFESNRLGAYITDNAELGLWEACDFRYNTQAGTLLENTAAIVGSAEGIYGHQFNRCHWESNTGKGVVLDGAGSNTFNACKWEDNSGTSVELAITNAATRPDENTFQNCIWNGKVGSPQWDVDIQRGRFTVFIGGSMCGPNNNGINIGSTNTFDTTFVGTTFVDTSKVIDPNDSTWYVATNLKTRTPQQPKTTPSYSASITPNAHGGPWATITVTGSAAFAINAPTFPPSSTQTDELTIEVFNNSGGPMGAITWNGVFVFAGLTWTNPANTKRRFARFEWNGTNWVCTSVASGDY